MATLRGSYGKGKASGVNRWSASGGSVFLATLPVKSSPRDCEFAFRLRETGPRHHGGAFSPAHRVDLLTQPCAEFVRVGLFSL